MVRYYLLSISAAIFFITTVQAQPTLLFKRIDASNYPEISLYFKVTCNGQFQNVLDKQYFKVYENGILVGEYELWCPDSPDCCISATLVLDCTGSMSSLKKLDNMKEGAKIFIDQLNTDGYNCDEASIISFNTSSTLVQGMTDNNALLTNAVQSLSAKGNTAVWDATIHGVQYTSTNASNRCRAVVVLTDGGDNSSINTLYDAVTVALANDVRVFTISYGTSLSPSAIAALQYLANVTGGSYYEAPSSNDVANIFSSIREIIRDSYQECYIKYIADCPDGRQRVVDLSLIDFCNGSSTQTRSYTAPLDQSQWDDFHVRLGNASIMATEEVRIPITVSDKLTAVFAEADISIGFNQSYLTFDRVETDSTLLEGIPVSWTKSGSGVTLHTNDKFKITTPGTLFYLYFTAADVSAAVRASLTFVNWSFNGYCLIPKMDYGWVDITPRTPALHCTSSAPTQLTWNDAKKQYSPNPFTFTTEITNTGTKESIGTVATISYDSKKVRLKSPITDTQPVNPSSVPAGGSGTVSWQLEALTSEEFDLLDICVTTKADNHEAIRCCETIKVSPVQTSQIICGLTAPDTVYFREQYYEPETFDVTLMAANTGDGMSIDVVGQLLQDTRFTKLTATQVILASQLLAGDTAWATFHVQMIPKNVDGYDTIWAQVQGSDSDPAWCYYPVYVQRVRNPEFTLLCTTTSDSLTFSEELGDYVPNPFTVTTFAENIGETYAEECQVQFVGPERFTPLGTNPRDIGLMNIHSTNSEQWQIRALPRTVGGWDTLHFQILGKGGLGRKIVTTDCYLPVYVPPMRYPQIQALCDAPDSLVFENVDYIPNPLTFTATLVNTGNSAAFNLNPKVTFPSYMSLASGSQSQHINRLDAGDSKTLSWTIRCDKRLVADNATICVSIDDSGVTSGKCCKDVFISAVFMPSMQLTCSTIDTLFINSSNGEYMGNPFTFTATIHNSGGALAQDVQVSINVKGTHVTIEDSITRYVGDIESGGSRLLTWRIRALNRTQSDDIPIIVTVSELETGELRCDKSVYIPAHQSPNLEAVCWSVPEDSIFFDWNIGDFEYPEFDVNIDISNTGQIRAENTSALLILPDGISFAENELAEKYISSAMLERGQHETLSWRVKPSRDDNDLNKEFNFVVRADNASEVACADDIWIQGSPKHITLSVPQDILFRFGQKGYIPVEVDRTIGKDLNSYVFVMEYDPEVISLLHLSTASTLTEYGWVGARMREVQPGMIEITDYTTGTPLHTEAGTLVRIYAEGIYQRDREIDELGYSELILDPGQVILNYGDIDVSTENGSIYVTNECVEPLTAGEGYTLSQNRPNPFNPSTTIQFALPADSYVRITVIDKLGRNVTELVSDTYTAGEHEVLFNAEGMPSGVYFYKLEANGITKLRKMVLAR